MQSENRKRWKRGGVNKSTAKMFKKGKKERAEGRKDSMWMKNEIK